MKRAWLYARRSNDDDVTLESIENQLSIAREYCEKHGYKVVGESFDNHVTGMHFNRGGINQLTAAVEEGLLDAVIVKDLSRLGRHRTQTALFIDFLREYGVAVISATENLDTMKEEDDLLIGVRGVMNDYYAKDLANKIRAGYRQKQKVGLVIKPPFGYWKDKNTGMVLLHPEASVTVRMIFSWYEADCGLKEIARRLNKLRRKTPGQVEDERCGKSGENYLWTNTTVKKILENECYTGLLLNHQTEIKNGKKAAVSEEEHIRHEGYFPVIIEREEWELVQGIIRQVVRATYCNKTVHRYAGLLFCGDCGNRFIPIMRHTQQKTRVEYICKSYQSYGREYCESHRIREEYLDNEVRQQAKKVYNRWLKELERTKMAMRLWELKRPKIKARVEELHRDVERLEEEIEEILMERMKG